MTYLPSCEITPSHKISDIISSREDYIRQDIYDGPLRAGEIAVRCATVPTYEAWRLQLSVSRQACEVAVSGSLEAVGMQTREGAGWVKVPASMITEGEGCFVIGGTGGFYYLKFEIKALTNIDHLRAVSLHSHVTVPTIEKEMDWL